MITQEQVLAALRNVQDPDLHKDLVTLNFIKNLKIEGSTVSFDVELTTPACPVKDLLKDQCYEQVKAIAGVEGVNITMTAQVRTQARESKVLTGVKHIIAVGSGKGGVGKSTCSVNLAVALAQSGARVGLMDADVYGPSTPMMVGVTHFEPEGDDGKVKPLEVHGLKVISMGLLAGPDKPLIWRGPIASRAIQQFLNDVDWGELDYLIIDLPPGTGDIQLTLCQTVPLSGAVIVTTPQDVAVGVTKRGLSMFQQVNVPILGIIENMAGFNCPHCNESIDIFTPTSLDRLAETAGTEHLGSIPLDADLVKGSDEGVPITLKDASNPVSKAFKDIASKVAARLSVLSFGDDNLTPEHIKYDDGDLHIQWKDGQFSHYNAANLRLQCPCAVCVDENTGQRKITADMIADDIKVKSLEKTGRYALRLIWSDGHQTGLYNYTFLKQAAA